MDLIRSSDLFQSLRPDEAVLRKLPFMRSVWAAATLTVFVVAGCGGSQNEDSGSLADRVPTTVTTAPSTVIKEPEGPPKRILGVVSSATNVRSDGLDCRADGLEPGEFVTLLNGAGTEVSSATTRRFTQEDFDGPRSSGDEPLTVADLAADQLQNSGQTCYLFFEFAVDTSDYETFELVFGGNNNDLVWTRAELSRDNYLMSVSRTQQDAG